MQSTNLNLTRHAQVRMQQRGITRKTIETIMVYADRRTMSGRGCMTLSLTHRRVDELIAADLVTPQQSDSLTQFSLVRACNGEIVTVYPRNRRANRDRYKRSKSFYHRNSQRTPRRLGGLAHS